MIAALPEEWVSEHIISTGTQTAEDLVIGISKAFKDHITG
jgi:hypothetical protein